MSGTSDNGRPLALAADITVTADDTSTRSTATAVPGDNAGGGNDSAGGGIPILGGGLPRTGGEIAGTVAGGGSPDRCSASCW